MTSPVHTGTFFILEGLLAAEREIVTLAVSFDRAALVAFTMALGEAGTTDFDAFRITENGDVLVTELPKATHVAPSKPV